MVEFTGHRRVEELETTASGFLSDNPALVSVRGTLCIGVLLNSAFASFSRSSDSQMPCSPLVSLHAERALPPT